MPWPLWDKAKADIEEIRARICTHCWADPEECLSCSKVDDELEKLRDNRTVEQGQ